MSTGQTLASTIGILLTTFNFVFPQIPTSLMTGIEQIQSRGCYVQALTIDALGYVHMAGFCHEAERPVPKDKWLFYVIVNQQGTILAQWDGEEMSPQVSRLALNSKGEATLSYSVPRMEVVGSRAKLLFLESRCTDQECCHRAD